MNDVISQITVLLTHASQSQAFARASDRKVWKLVLRDPVRSKAPWPE